MKINITRISFNLSHVLFSGFIFRVLLIPFFNDDFNFWAARVFSSIWTGGFNPWSIVFHDPTLYWINPWRYPPPYIGFVALAQFFGAAFSNEILFLYALKLPLILADTITVFFIYKIVMILKENRREAVLFAFFYAFNPVTIFISSVWGTMEPIPVMFTVMALYYFIDAKSGTRLSTSAVLLGLGIAFKLYPIFILPVFLAKLRRLREILPYVLLALLPIALFSFPFLLWDHQSYIGLLLLHNVGGLHPLFPVFYPETSTLIQVGFLSFAAILFVAAYLRNTPVVVNLTLSFLALYFALGGNLATYSAWMVPFAILLLADKGIRKIRSFWLLPFFPMVSIAYALIYNGPYNSVEGVTGIYYWTYHWARQKVIVFRSGSFVDLQVFLAFASILLLFNMAIILYFFVRAIRCKCSLSMPKTQKNRNSASFKVGRNRKACFMTSAIIILLLSMVVSTSTIPFEPVKPMPQVSPGTLIFYDDFNSSLLNYQWAFLGEGNYVLNYDSIPTHITFNAVGMPYNRSAIYRGWGPFLHGFYESNAAIVGLRFRFEGLVAGSSGLVIIKTDGGYFGVRKDLSGMRFNYFDDVGNNSLAMTPVDGAWHVFELIYNSSGRFIYFENSLAGKLEARNFSFLYLGNPETTGDFSGSISIDWVKVELRDFPASIWDEPFSFLAIGGPTFISTLIVVVLMFSGKKRSANGKKVYKSDKEKA